jgi:hypothetical protein
MAAPTYKDITDEWRPGLQRGDEVFHRRCGHWHVLDYQERLSWMKPDEARTLWFTCEGGDYFGGRAGTKSLGPARRRVADEPDM